MLSEFYFLIYPVNTLLKKYGIHNEILLLSSEFKCIYNMPNAYSEFLRFC